MTEVRYDGRADTRSLEAKDFKRLGVEDQNKVVWNGPGNIQNVSDDAADVLTSHLSNEFSLANDQSDGDESLDQSDDSEESTNYPVL